VYEHPLAVCVNVGFMRSVYEQPLTGTHKSILVERLRSESRHEIRRSRAEKHKWFSVCSVLVEIQKYKNE
jgi:hypothetical protein